MVESDQLFLQALNQIFALRFDVGLTYRTGSRYGPINSGVMIFKNVSEKTIGFFNRYIHDTHRLQKHLIPPCHSGYNQLALADFRHRQSVDYYSTFTIKAANYSVQILSLPMTIYNRPFYKTIDANTNAKIIHFPGKGKNKVSYAYNQIFHQHNRTLKSSFGQKVE